ncbi:UDP-2,3-diacylglucosamine diphosphatase [bacterium]|nr:UDP-2,3-diacylglucosamine diphosphatase [bacterium]
MTIRTAPVEDLLEPLPAQVIEHEGRWSQDSLDAMPLVEVNVRTSSKTLKADTVVISDVHLGSHVCRAKELRKALRSWFPFRRLIILGDLFDDLNFSRLNKHHFGVIDDFRRLTSSKRGVEVDWIEGNHDQEAHDVIHRIIGANVHDELVLEFGKHRYLFMHGHQFDNFLYDHPIISVMAGKIYEKVQSREGGSNNMSRWLKKKSKGWLKVCKKIEEKAILYAASREADFIVCGHTHYHDADTETPQKMVQYINTGCWTDSPSTLTVFDEKGYRHHLYR